MPDPSLCAVCLDCLVNHRGLRPQIRDWNESYFDHHFSLASLEESSDTGCAVCTELWTKKRSNVTFTRERPITRIKISWSSPIELTAAYEEKALHPEFAYATQSVSFLLRSAQDGEQYHSRYDASGWTGSPEVWAVAIKWMYECSTQHRNCKQICTSPWYPTRLVDVGTRAGEPARVIVSAEHQLEGGYVTLSHRWGDAINVKLLRSNCQDLFRMLDMDRLPLTFQHAVETVRRLQMRYIWIDSLCIFQDADDKSDWNLEASRMEKVYLHGLLNISATGAEDSSKGLFQRRNGELQLRRLLLTCSKPAMKNSPRSEPTTYVLDDLLLIRDSIHNAPLSRRAWVLQERFLSARVLHFARDQVFWECGEGIVCERYPEQLPPKLAGRIDSKSFKSYETRFFGLLDKSSELKAFISSDQGKYTLLERWREVIRAYSNTDISFHSDRVIAIAGVAAALGEIFEEEYIIGMWRCKLEGQLLWSVYRRLSDAADKAQRPSTYRAPSWSWLSVEGGEISLVACSWKMLHFEVLDLSLKHGAQGQMGLVTDGSITLRGHLRAFYMRRERFRHNSRAYWAMTMDSAPINVTIQLDIEPSDDVIGGRNIALHLLLGGTMHKHEVSQHAMHIMLLLRCVDQCAGVFERIGTASFNVADVTEDGARGQEAWHRLNKKVVDAASYPCVAYDGDADLHTIIVK